MEEKSTREQAMGCPTEDQVSKFSADEGLREVEGTEVTDGSSLKGSSEER